jgi:pseudouridine-5'-phosphate glycosidase
VADLALAQDEFELALGEAQQKALAAGVRGKELTPFLLTKLADITEGKTLLANQALVTDNARLAARVACALQAL